MEESGASFSIGGDASNPVAPNSNDGDDATLDTSDWHVKFLIPDLRSFSHHVKDTVTTGLITARARKEIIQVLRTYMTAYTVRPTPEEYTTVCRKLVEKYPSLKDTKGKTKFVSLNNLWCNCRYCFVFVSRVHGSCGYVTVSRISGEAANKMAIMNQNNHHQSG